MDHYTRQKKAEALQAEQATHKIATIGSAGKLIAKKIRDNIT